MNGYERLVKILKSQSDSSTCMFLAAMESPNSLYINKLKLESDDLLIAEHLTTGWYKDANTFIGPLKQGDMVVVMKLSETKYAILERVV